MALDTFNPYLFVSAGEQSNKFLTPTYEDGIAKFQAQRAQPLNGLTVRIDPIQDLNGQENPYPAGGGKNKFNLDSVTAFNANVTVTKTADSFTIVNNNSYAVGVFRDANGDIRFPVTDGQYTISIGQAITESIVVYASTNGTDFSWFDGGITAGNTSKTFTISGQTYVTFFCTCPASGGTLTIKQFQFEKSATKTAYAPYSNICPISGHTGMTVTVQSGETQNEYHVTWESSAGTIYGGTLDVVSGVLTVDKAIVTLNGTENIQKNGRTTIAQRAFINISGKAPGIANIQSDRFAVTSSTDAVGRMVGRQANDIVEFYIPLDETEDTDASCKQWFADNNTQLVYELATPQTYRLTGAEVQTIPGFNQIYSDAGPVIDIKF